MPDHADSAMRRLETELNYIPARLRRAVIRRMADLISGLLPDESYTYDDVFHRITRFHPDAYAGVLLTGAQLARGLSAMLQRFSLETPLDGGDPDHPVIPLEDIIAHERVTPRTARRWALRGMPLACYRFDNGRCGWGVRREEFERFRAASRRRAPHAATKLSEKERRQILCSLAALQKDGNLATAEIVRNVCRQSGRSAATVRRLLRQQRELRAAAPGDSRHYSGLSPGRRKELVALYRSGVPVRRLAAQFGRSGSTIYRVLHQILVDQICDLKINYVPSAEFAERHAEERCLGDEGLFTYPPEPTSDMPRAPKGIPPYLRDLYSVPLLGRPRERELFRKYNYIKCRLAMRQEQVRRKGYCARLIDRFDELRQAAAQVRRILIRCNLRLVVSVAKRHVGPVARLMDLVSEGNMCLMRAVECFDYTRNVRFATYATWAMTKHFARVVPEHNYRLNTFVTGRDDIFALVGDSRPDPQERVETVAYLRNTLAGAIKHLPERERLIIESHFGTDGRPTRTLEEIGKLFGLTRERIRQIEVRALARLREIVGPEVLEALG